MPRYDDYQFLAIDIREGIASVTLNRPEAHNACGPRGHTELSRVLRELSRDDDVRAIVSTGAGRHYSVGGDLEHMLSLHADPAARAEIEPEIRELVWSAIDCEKPHVAAVNGAAMGSGAVFALLADIIVCERNARFSDGHVRAALAAGDGGALFWPISVGLVRAKRYLLTGDLIRAEEAERIGLVSEVVERGEALFRAREYARRLAAGPQTAIRLTKRALNQWLRARAIACFDLSVAYEMETFASDQARSAFERLVAGESVMPPDPRAGDPTREPR